MIKQKNNNEMDMYNLVFNGIVLNKKPLTEKQSHYEIGLIIMNYGYRPEKVKIK